MPIEIPCYFSVIWKSKSYRTRLQRDTLNNASGGVTQNFHPESGGPSSTVSFMGLLGLAVEVLRGPHFSEHIQEIAVDDVAYDRKFRREVERRVDLEFCPTAKLRRVATKLVEKCKGYSPWRCAIDVASVKTTFSAAAPRRSAVLATVASASLLSDQRGRQRLFILLLCGLLPVAMTYLKINCDDCKKNKVGKLPNDF